MREPRGHAAMSGAILQPPTRDDADWGVLFIEVSGCLPMCGHGTIGVATVLVETGMVEVREPETVVRLDTPAGLVEARVAVAGGRAEAVTHPQRARLPARARPGRRRRGPRRRCPTTWPSAATSTRSSTPPRSGSRSIRRARASSSRPAPGSATRSPSRCTRSTRASPAAITSSSTRRGATARDARNATAIHPGWLDRSPCGTGTSARMAALHARGELALGRGVRQRVDHRHALHRPPRRGGRGRRRARPSCPRSPGAHGSPRWASTCSTSATPSRPASPCEAMRGGGRRRRDRRRRDGLGAARARRRRRAARPRRGVGRDDRAGGGQRPVLGQGGRPRARAHDRRPAPSTTSSRRARRAGPHPPQGRAHRPPRARDVGAARRRASSACAPPARTATWWTPRDVRAIEPELTGELAGASFFPGDLQCAPRAIARGARRRRAARAHRRGGAGDRGRARRGDRRAHERRRAAVRGGGHRGRAVEPPARRGGRRRAPARAAQGPARAPARRAAATSASSATRSSRPATWARWRAPTRACR